MRGIAFKTNYNNGGANGGLIGYRGVCSDPIIMQNVKSSPRPWCSNKKCDCRKYVDRHLTPPRPKKEPCFESRLLKRPFRFGPGIYLTGKKAGKPIPINNAENGDIVFLTVIPPGRTQKGRIIFGCYRIGDITRNTDEGHFLESDETMDIRLPDDVARKFFYCDYDNRMWNSGIFRYLDEECTHNLIADLLYRLGDDHNRDILFSAFDGEIRPRPSVIRYGRGGGESVEHQRLKKLVATEPQRVGLPKRSKPTIEHLFLSGDHVDVKFDLPDGKAAVVEVETEVPLPGAHQAVKYRSLLEVERGDELCAGTVQAIVVAHHFDEKTRQFSRKYNIKLVRLRA